MFIIDFEHIKYVNQFQSSDAFHIETSQLICNANQITGFYMKCKAGLTWINPPRTNAPLFQCFP